jgi:hypothetical protein
MDMVGQGGVLETMAMARNLSLNLTLEYRMLGAGCVRCEKWKSTW